MYEARSNREDMSEETTAASLLRSVREQVNFSVFCMSIDFPRYSMHKQCMYCSCCCKHLWLKQHNTQSLFLLATCHTLQEDVGVSMYRGPDNDL